MAKETTAKAERAQSKAPQAPRALCLSPYVTRTSASTPKTAQPFHTGKGDYALNPKPHKPHAHNASALMPRAHLPALQRQHTLSIPAKETTRSIQSPTSPTRTMPQPLCHAHICQHSKDSIHPCTLLLCAPSALHPRGHDAKHHASALQQFCHKPTSKASCAEALMNGCKRMSRKSRDVQPCASLIKFTRLYAAPLCD